MKQTYNFTSHTRLVMQRAEKAVCRATQETLRTNVTTIRKDKNKPTLAVSIARGITFHILHVFFNVRYRDMAQYAGMTIGAVMKCAAKARTYIVTDETYSYIYQNIMKQL